MDPTDPNSDPDSQHWLPRLQCMAPVPNSLISVFRKQNIFSAVAPPPAATTLSTAPLPSAHVPATHPSSPFATSPPSPTSPPSSVRSPTAGTSPSTAYSRLPRPSSSSPAAAGVATSSFPDISAAPVGIRKTATAPEDVQPRERPSVQKLKSFKNLSSR